MQKILFFLGFLCINLTLQAQTDTEFWFAAPDIAIDHGPSGRPLYFHVSAINNTTVTISRPADPSWGPMTFNLNQGDVRSIRLDDLPVPFRFPGTYNDQVNYIENHPGPVQQNGFKIESYPGEITVFYELTYQNNKDIFSLKGKNGLGREFTVTTQNIFSNWIGRDAWPGFVIVATEPNTTVNVTLNSNFKGHPAGNHTIVLPNPGDTYVFESATQTAGNHPQGEKVVADKDIAITMYDDSMDRNAAFGNGGCKDTYGDQLVPDALLGREYLVLRGQLGVPFANPSRQEMIFITGTVNGTNVSIEDDAGVVLATTTVNDGDVYPFSITNRLTYVVATEPVVVNHVTGFGCEQGGAQLPTIDGCTGSHDVTFARSYPANNRLYLNIMVRNDTLTGSPTRNQAVNNFTLTVGGVTVPIPASYFAYTADSAFAYLIDDGWPGVVNNFFNTRIPAPVPNNAASPPTVGIVRNPIARFHLGVINGNLTGGCKYGYFSDYASSAHSAGIGGATGPTLEPFCNLDPFQIAASGGTEYLWKCVSHPHYNHLISDSTASSPYFSPILPDNYIFSVTIAGECYTDTTIQMLASVNIGPSPNFSISDAEGCSPFTPTLTNLTDTSYHNNMTWLFEPPKTVISQGVLPWSFNRIFVNKTDTVQVYNVELTASTNSNVCPATLRKTIKVKPEVLASFTPDTAGCHPLPVNFNNTSTGHLDSTSYFWDFGDGSQSFDSLPSHTFNNYDPSDVNYTTRLIVESPLNCRDTAYQNINVYPRVQAQFSIDTNFGCSPFTFNLSPSGSIGTDSLTWRISNGTSHVFYDRTKLTSVPHTHRDTTYLNGPDTLNVGLIGKNLWNCVSIAADREIVVYPEIISRLTVDSDEVCDSVPVNFSNLSLGNNLKFEWNFGDFTFLQDSTLGSHQKVYLNRSDSTKEFTATLKAVSEFKCVSLHDTIIKVHPYLNAGFGLGYPNNCSPVEVTLNNTSTRVTDYNWSMGDGASYIYDTASFRHRFINPSLLSDTTFTLRLIGKNPEGCADTTTRSLFIHQPVVAGFSLDTNMGCSPFDAQITNTSNISNLIFNWKFGSDSDVEQALNFTHRFNNYSENDSTYIISLQAMSPAGCDSTVTDTVRVLAYIDSKFSMPVVDSCSPLTLRPTNLSSAGSKINNWDFGNGATSSDKNPVVPTYRNRSDVDSIYYVTLTTYGKEDAQHKSCADKDTIIVTVHPEFRPAFVVHDTMGCQPLISGITNNSMPSAGTSYLWTLDGSPYDNKPNPKDLHIKNLTENNVSHDLWMYGRTQHGCRDSINQSLLVYSHVKAYFTTSKPEFCSGDSTLVNRSGTHGGIVKYSWDLNGENNNNTDTTFFVSYDNLGGGPTPKYITLKVENLEQCDSSYTEWVNVFPKVTAEFSVDNDTICYPAISNFFSNSTNATNFTWNFDDGVILNDENPVHQLVNSSNTLSKTFTVKLIAESDNYCSDSIEHPVTVHAKPKADFEYDKSIDCPPFTAEIKDKSVGSDLTYNWNFNNEDVSAIEEPTYLFYNDDSITVEKFINLLVVSDENCIDSLTKIIRVYPDPKVEFSSTPSEGCSPLSVEFLSSTENVKAFEWILDDNYSFYNNAHPSRQFDNQTPNDLSYQVKLIGSSEYGCTDSAEKTITVYPTPVPEFIPSPIPATYNTELNYTTITYNNLTAFQDNWNYEWNYGDSENNETGNQDGRPIIDYNYGYQIWGDINDGNQLTVTLSASNKNNPECNGTAVQKVIVNPPLPQVDMGPDVEGCVPFTVPFTAITNYNYDEDAHYEWEFGITGETATGATPPTYTYTEPGVYTAKLSVHGDGGTNWDYKLIAVNTKPVADFTISDTLVYDSSQTKGYDWIDFFNHSKFGGTYRWYFDSEDLFEEGSYKFDIDDTLKADSYLKEPRWAYPNVGEYYVTLIVESYKGCFDTLKNSTTPIRVLGEGQLQFPTGFFLNPTTAPPSEYDTDQRQGNLYLFYPRNQGIDKYKLEVYNKWGVLLFETDDVNRGWNGYFEGLPVKQDVYVWRAKGKFSNGQAFNISGDITLIRTEVNVTQ